MNSESFFSRTLAHYANICNESPSYFFDRATLGERYEELATEAAESGFGLVAAVKAFPDREALGMAHTAGMGFDVSNATEIRLILPHIAPSSRIQLCGPAWAKNDLELLWSIDASVIAIIETDTQLDLICSCVPQGTIGLRVNVSTVVDATQLDSMEPSRFGMAADRVPDVLKELVQKGWKVGLQIHDGLRPHTLATYCELADGLKRIAEKSSSPVAFFSLGGGLHYLTQDVRASLFQKLRSVIGETPAFLEPGGYLSSESGILVTNIVSWSRKDDVVSLIVAASSEAHLKWSKPRMLLPNRKGTRSWQAKVFGNTCFEADKMGEFFFDSDEKTLELFLKRGIAIFTGVSAYSFAWQAPFNGVPVLPLYLI
jgi:diaminopimelate decarboxylase